MDQPMCDKCYLPMIAVKAKAIRGIPVVTVKCVGCGLKKDIGPNKGGEDDSKRRSIW